MSARFRARAPGPVSGQLCSAPRRENRARRRWFPAAFRLPAFASWASCPARGFRPSYDRPTAPACADPSGVSMFRTREMRLGPGALYTPGTAVPSRPGTFPDRRLPPPSGRSLSPRYHYPSRGVFVTRHQRGFTGVRPIQPSPRLWPPDGTGTLGLSPELHTPLSRTQRRMSGRGRASALPEVTSSASLTSPDALTHRERPHVAQVVESDLSPVDIQPAYDGHRDLLELSGGRTPPHANCLRSQS